MKFLLKKKDPVPCVRAEAVIRARDEEMRQDCLKASDQIANIVTRLPTTAEPQLQECAAYIMTLCRARLSLLESLQTKPPAAPVLPQYRVSLLLLQEMAAYLLADPRRFERMNVGCGSFLDDHTRMITRFVPVRMVDQSAVYVALEDDDYERTVRTFREEYAQWPLVIAHCHRSTGAASTEPSPIDIRDARRRVKNNYQGIYIIVSEDGWVRAWNFTPFHLEVEGNVTVHRDTPCTKLLRLPKADERS